MAKKTCPICNAECGYWDFVCWKCKYGFWWPPVRRFLILIAFGLAIGILSREGVLPPLFD